MPPEQRRSPFPTVIIGIAILAAIGIGGYFVWNLLGERQSTEPTPELEVPQVIDTTSTYATTTLGLSLEYPNDFTLNEAYANTSVSPTKPIAGVKFTVPATMATGTNLSADTGISIEWLPRARLCTGDIYLAANVRASEITEGGISYSLASSTEGAAGNRYEEIVYALASSTPCTAIRYFIHSTSIQNYPTGTVREFDRAALIAQFDAIRKSLVIQ